MIAIIISTVELLKRFEVLSETKVRGLSITNLPVPSFPKRGKRAPDKILPGKTEIKGGI
jgi:hypothetical protein